MPNFNLIAALSLCCLAGSHLAAAQATGTSSRLISEARTMLKNGAYVPYDSTDYAYPSASSSSYASVTSYNLSPGTVPRLQTLYTYDAAGFLICLEMLSWNAPTNKYIRGARQLFTNDASGRVTEEQYQNWNNAKSFYENGRRSIYKRSSAGNVTEQEDQVWDPAGSLWRRTALAINAYNAANKRTRSAVDKYQPGSGLSASSLQISAYDAGGTVLLSDTLTTMDALGTLQRTELSLYTNNAAGNPLAILQLERSATTGKTDSVLRYNYTYTGTNRTSETTEYWSSGGSRQYSSRVDNTFNSDDQMVLSTFSPWNGASFDPPTLRTVYHYERFTPTAVTPAGANAPLVTISPNPAIDAAQIAISASGAFRARIIDLQGRVHQQFSGNASSGFLQHISLAAMPAGTYVFQVQPSTGNSVARMLTVVR